MVEVHEQISGFTQTIQKEILKRSNGVVSRVPELVQEAMEGAFKTQTCRGLKGKFMCEYIPEELADSIIQLVERYTAGGVSIKRIIEKLNSI